MKIDFKKMKMRYKILLTIAIVLLILFSTLYVYLLVHDRNLIVVYSRSLPDMDDIDFQIVFNKQAADLSGEEITMQKEPQIKKLLEEAKEDKDVWDEIIQIEKEIDAMNEKEWGYRKEYYRLIWVKSLKEEMQIIGFSKLKIDGVILVSYPKEYELESKLKTAKMEMDELEATVISKEEELHNLYERAKNGENIIDKIEKLRSEIKELEQEYNNKKDNYIQLRVMLDTALFVI